MGLLLGAIGDDITGSTDLALTLSNAGMPAVQYMGVPSGALPAEEMPAAVVALKTRTAPLEEAVSQSIEACKWLLHQGAGQIFFKYCSTFDSTEKGNIGPVAEALADLLGADITIVCPAFPANARTVYQGHLFVGAQLLNNSGMRNHPLTPMRDANLLRLMAQQVRSTDSVGLIPFSIVSRGPAAIREQLAELGRSGVRFAIVDALTDPDLMAIGSACRGLKLITGGSGVAMGLPMNYRNSGQLVEFREPNPLPRLKGGLAVIAGSCSSATREQTHHMSQRHPALKIDPLRLALDPRVVDEAVTWARSVGQEGPFLIFSSDDPDVVANIQAELGRDNAGRMVEDALSDIAVKLYQEGIRKFIVAGGETSGAVLEALGIQSLRIGPEIDPGVPWTVSTFPDTLCLALKSGNFGSTDFFEKAWEMLP